MKQETDTVARDELRESYAARIHWAIVRAKVCMSCARAARRRGDFRESERWVAAAKVLRATAAALRAQGGNILSALICILGALHGCAKTHSATQDRVTFGFDPHEDGSITWVVEFEADAWKETLSQGEARTYVTVLSVVGISMGHNGIEGRGCQITSHEELHGGGERIMGRCRSTGVRGERRT